MKLISVLLVKVILPLLLLIIVFKYNVIYGLGVVFILILIGIFYSRSEIYAFIGNKKYISGKYSDSITWMRKAYNTKGCIIKYKNAFGYLLIKTGNIQEAEKVLTELESSKLTNDEQMIVKVNLALLVWKKGNIYRAVTMLEDVYKDFKNTKVYINLGLLLTLQGNLEKALEFNLEAYDYNDSSAFIQDNLGRNYYLLGMYDKAQEIYEKTMAISPSFPEAYYNYSLVLAKKGMTDKALEFALKSLNYEFMNISIITKEDAEANIKELQNALISK
ncbi:tetratricopeptide repeat protein [Clostridium lacusfryxellense]|uniref:tetratricopeptide repeat protein n=1 Tax=Clostridium lacusfryxellense TaxID=205328 RepID=UPI001C0BFCBD|nr:tetratricopeptide repeat protein [Clostridium lacusfryxellense]MBU3113176.1 tetratricopeptide repeat protein [Clostridium lacusfryxellense]